MLQRTEHTHSFAIIKYAEHNHLQFAAISFKTGTSERLDFLQGYATA